MKVRSLDSGKSYTWASTYSFLVEMPISYESWFGSQWDARTPCWINLLFNSRWSVSGSLIFFVQLPYELIVKPANSVILMNHSRATPASPFNASACVVFFLFKGRHSQFVQSKLRWNPKLVLTTSIPVRLRRVLRGYDKLSSSTISGDCDCVTNGTSMSLGFLFLDWWFSSVSAAAWAEEMSPEVCEESLTISSSIGSGRAELLSNCGRLSELELREDYGAFPRFVFWLVILNEYEK